LLHNFVYLATVPLSNPPLVLTRAKVAVEIIVF